MLMRLSTLTCLSVDNDKIQSLCIYLSCTIMCANNWLSTEGPRTVCDVNMKTLNNKFFALNTMRQQQILRFTHHAAEVIGKFI